MKAKKIKIPINNLLFINKRSLSNKSSRRNIAIYKKNNSNKMIVNNSDNDISRIDTTTETSMETMKKITIYKKNTSRPKNSINLIRKNDSNFINANDGLIHYTSAKDLFKENNYKTKLNKKLDISLDNNIINTSLQNINLIKRMKDEKKNFNNIHNKFFPNINEYRNQMKKNDFINIEDLLLMEEIFHDIFFALKMKSNIGNECFELINFYNHSSLYNKFEIYFKDDISKNIVHLSILKMLYCIMLLYHYSFNNYLFNKNYEYLHTLINLNYKNFLLLCEYISNKISSKESENIFVKKLRFMLTHNLKHITVDNKEFRLFFSNTNIDLNISNLNCNLIEIKYYLFLIQKNIRILLKNLINDQFQNDLYYIDRFISNLSGGEIINFFRKKIFHIINKNGSVCGNDASFYGGKESIKDIKIPYLNYKSNKKFTLVLDLDETLISFKMLDSTKNQGILRLRPGLYEFLTNVKINYELIIFTSATKEYADPLIDAIEKKEKYFDFRLYRQHTIICDNEFVKDIGRLGRPMNKLIIVDNLPQNFRLQKENGIMIKAFWGEDVYDTALYELSIVLNKIANNKFYDTRKGIIAYKNDILSKVSSCFSRTNTFE